jgi:hypothetical protein
MMYGAGIVIIRNDNMIQLSWHNFHIAIITWCRILITLHENVPMKII